MTMNYYQSLLQIRDSRIIDEFTFSLVEEMPIISRLKYFTKYNMNQ